MTSKCLALECHSIDRPFRYPQGSRTVPLRPSLGQHSDHLAFLGLSLQLETFAFPLGFDLNSAVTLTVEHYLPFKPSDCLQDIEHKLACGRRGFEPKGQYAKTHGLGVKASHDPLVGH